MKKDFVRIKEEVHKLYTQSTISIQEIAYRHDNSPSERTIRRWASEQNYLWKRERFRNLAGNREELLPESIALKITAKIDDILSAEGSKFNVKSAENVVKLSLLLEKLKSEDTLKLYTVYGLDRFIKYLEIFVEFFVLSFVRIKFFYFDKHLILKIQRIFFLLQ